MRVMMTNFGENIGVEVTQNKNAGLTSGLFSSMSLKES